MGDAWDKWTQGFAQRAGLVPGSPGALALQGVGSVAQGQAPTLPPLAPPVLAAPLPPPTVAPPAGHSPLQAAGRVWLGTVPGLEGSGLVDKVFPAQAPVTAPPAEAAGPVEGEFAPPPGAAFGMPSAGPTSFKVIPEHRRTQGWSVSEAVPMDDQEKLARDAALESKTRVLETEADAGRYDAMRKEAFARGQLGAQSFYEEQNALHREQAQQKRDALLADMEREHKAAQDNPDTLLGKGVSKFLGMIGVALGAWGGSIKGTGQNAGLQAMQAFAAEEAAAQKLKADKENNYFARMRTIFNDDEMAEKATQEAILRLGQAKVSAITATSKAESARANGDRVNQVLSEDIGNLRKEITIRGADRVQRTDVNVPTQYLAMGGPGLGAKDADVEKYGEARTKAGIPEAQQSLAEVQARVDAYAKSGKSIEGVAGPTVASGWLEDKKPDGVLTPQGLANRQMIGQFVADYRHAMTGAGGSDAEAEKFEKNIRGAKTTAELQRALQQGQNKLHALERAQKATYKPNAVAEYHRRLGPSGSEVGFAGKGLVPTVKPAGDKP